MSYPPLQSVMHALCVMMYVACLTVDNAVPRKEGRVRKGDKGYRVDRVRYRVGHRGAKIDTSSPLMHQHHQLVMCIHDPAGHFAKYDDTIH